jgi:Kdo2-lipid IVA lauroyltransferase/acyltransferase
LDAESKIDPGTEPEEPNTCGSFRFSFRWHVLLGKLLGIMIYGLDPRHRRIAAKNLTFAFPKWSQSEVDGVVRRTFQNLGITFLEIVQMSYLSHRNILNKVRVENGNAIEAMIDHPNGAILISAHIGNWEMSHVFASARYNREITLVARALDFGPLDRWINNIRSKFGNRIWYKKGALHHLAKTLRIGGIVGMLIDQEARNDEACKALFFNHAINATPAPALLARRYECPVLPVFCIREIPGNRLVLKVGSPLELVKTKDRQSDIQINTQMMISAVETIVREYPDQWFWVHKRWKRHHPELYPEDMARHERRKEKKRKKRGK